MAKGVTARQTSAPRCAAAANSGLAFLFRVQESSSAARAPWTDPFAVDVLNIIGLSLCYSASSSPHVARLGRAALRCASDPARARARAPPHACARARGYSAD